MQRNGPAIELRQLYILHEWRGQGAAQALMDWALAEAKARDVASARPEALVIGSDQTLSLCERVFHKPEDRAEAREHLRAMSGRSHELNSAVVLVRNGEIAWRHVSTARLTMRALSDDFIGRYLDRVGESILASVGACLLYTSSEPTRPY